MVMTSTDTPSVSDSRMNSWRFSRTGLSHIGEELNRADPLTFGQLHVPNEVVQMSDQRGHDPLETRIITLRQALNHRLGDALLIEFAHAVSP